MLWEVWKDTKEIVMLSPTGHDICDTCADLDSVDEALIGINTVEARALRAKNAAEREAHKAFTTAERAYDDAAYSKATFQPEDVTAIMIDAPTTHQMDCPQQARGQRDTAKRLDGTQRWSMKMEGVLDAGVGMLCFLARNGMYGGANLIVTVLYLTLFHHHQQSNRPIGRHLHIGLDNTTGENKNETVIGGVGLLVNYRKVFDAEIFFRPKGHTYHDLDAAFGTLINGLLRVAIATLSKMVEAMRFLLAAKRVRVIMQLDHTWDFNAVMTEHMHHLGGFATTQQSSGMHSIYIYRDEEGATRVRFRQSSMSAGWLPEGPGMLLFKNTLPGHFQMPPLAKLKTDSQWQALEVRANVRRWLPTLGLQPHEFVAAEQEWQQVFDALPANGDVNLLPAARRLAWIELPAAKLPSLPSGTGCASRRDMIENPEINPVYGHRRSADQVQKELKEHHSAAREHAEHIGEVPPVFLGDYLLVTLPRQDQGVYLARVSGAPKGGAYRSEDVFDFTEYQHTPQPGVPGLFGTFEMALNPYHDEKDHRSRKYLKHLDMTRAAVVVYNVSTFRNDKELRLETSALTSLSEVCPKQYPMPSQIPQSHGGGTGQDSKRRSASAGSKQQHGADSSARAGSQQQHGADKPVANKSRIEIYWTDEQRWFAGTATSSQVNDVYVLSSSSCLLHVCASRIHHLSRFATGSDRTCQDSLFPCFHRVVVR